MVDSSLYEMQMVSGMKAEDITALSIKTTIPVSDIKEFYLATKTLPNLSMAEKIRTMGAKEYGKMYNKFK